MLEPAENWRGVHSARRESGYHRWIGEALGYTLVWPGSIVQRISKPRGKHQNSERNSEAGRVSLRRMWSDRA
jgi:hypothetical protein